MAVLATLQNSAAPASAMLTEDINYIGKQGTGWGGGMTVTDAVTVTVASTVPPPRQNLSCLRNFSFALPALSLALYPTLNPALRQDMQELKTTRLLLLHLGKPLR